MIIITHRLGKDNNCMDDGLSRGCVKFTDYKPFLSAKDSMVKVPREAKLISAIFYHFIVRRALSNSPLCDV